MLFTTTKYVILVLEDYVMADRLKNRIRFSTTLDKKTVQLLKEYSDKTMIPSSKIIDVAIQEYIRNKEKSL